MTKHKTLQRLNAAIEKISNFPDNAKFNLVLNIDEKPKCPKCGTYEGDGFTVGNFLYTVAKCKCGYSYSE